MQAFLIIKHAFQEKSSLTTKFLIRKKTLSQDLLLFHSFARTDLEGAQVIFNSKIAPGVLLNILERKAFSDIFQDHLSIVEFKNSLHKPQRYYQYNKKLVTISVTNVSTTPLPVSGRVHSFKILCAPLAVCSITTITFDPALTRSIAPPIP